MRGGLLIGGLLTTLASAAAAETLTFSDLSAATTRAEIADQLQNCQAHLTATGHTVCAWSRSDLGGVPLSGALAQFAGDQLHSISLVAMGRFEEVSRLLERRYGPPARANSNRVVQDDGRTATIRNTEWSFDDGHIQLATAEVPGDPRVAIVRFTWRRLNF